MIYFIIYLFLEVMVSTAFASSLGGLLTFLEIIFTAFLGFFILANFKHGIFRSMQLLKERKITQEEFSALNIFSILGAFLLIIPGFLSDILGVALQVNFLTTFLGATILKDRFVKRDSGGSQMYDEDVIDVEVIERR